MNSKKQLSSMLALAKTLLVCYATSTNASAQSLSLWVGCGIGGQFDVAAACDRKQLTDQATNAVFNAGYIPGQTISTSTTYSSAESAIVDGTAYSKARANYGDLGLDIGGYMHGVYNGSVTGYYQAQTDAYSSFYDKLHITTPNDSATIRISGYIDISELTNSTTTNELGQVGNGAYSLKLSIRAGDSFYFAETARPGWQGNLLDTGRNFFSLDVSANNQSDLILDVSLHGEANAVTYTDQIPRINGFSENSQLVKATTLNSLHLYADSLTPDTTLGTQSGHDYAAPVPEPSTLFLAFAGLVTAGLARRNQFVKKV